MNNMTLTDDDLDQLHWQYIQKKFKIFTNENKFSCRNTGRNEMDICIHNGRLSIKRPAEEISIEGFKTCYWHNNVNIDPDLYDYGLRLSAYLELPLIRN